MAIYTNYGRYVKAKQFKDMLESYGDTYMLLGLGNPQWDDPESKQVIPVAPYNLNTIKEMGQFFDDHLNLSYTKTDAVASENAILDSNPCPNQLGEYVKACGNLIPPFPATWNFQGYPIATFIIEGDNGSDGDVQEVRITQDNYASCYVQKDPESGRFLLTGKVKTSGGDIVEIQKKPIEELPPINSLDRQYFSEMYLRGKAVENGFKAPVGLLGAVRCAVDFVKDIGDNPESYTGDVSQFWYGDRYWQIVRPVDPIRGSAQVNIDSYINSDAGQDVYPHHLLFTAMVNPRALCHELQIDQYLVPRQISVFTASRRESGSELGARKKYYRAYENVFDFGQYGVGELPSPPSGGEVLKFALPVSVPSTDGTMYQTNKGEFEFFLNDYIRGQVRTAHTVDRFGYVVGF